MFVVQDQAPHRACVAVDASCIICMLVQGKCTGAEEGKRYFMRYNSTSRIG